MTQENQNIFYEFLNEVGPSLSETTQKKISCSFCRLIWDILDDLGRDSLIVAEKFTLGETSLKDCKKYQKKLQTRLPKENSSAHIYSPIIWALEEHSGSYPGYYAAAIAGLNVIELNKATNEQLLDIIKDNMKSNS